MIYQKRDNNSFLAVKEELSTYNVGTYRPTDKGSVYGP